MLFMGNRLLQIIVDCWLIVPLFSNHVEQYNYYLLVCYLELLELFTFNSVREFTPFSRIVLFTFLVRALFTTVYVFFSF